MLSREIVAKLKEIETPFYLYDTGLLRRTLVEVVRCSSRYGYRVHYAMKANFEERIIDTICEYGLGADCVSGNEVRHAIEHGFSPDSVVYAGVGKSDKEIRYSLEQGIFAFNCESRQELIVINYLAAEMGKVASVALRINPDIDPQTHRYISTGQSDDKFGIAYSEVEQVIAELPELKNINLTGIHFHIGSQITQMEVFEELCARANELYDWFTRKGLRLTHVNMGGGLGINYDDPESELIPDFESYFEVFHKNLKLGEGVEVHFELGRAIVAQCGELISRVLFKKAMANGQKVIIIDGSMTDLIRPALYEAHHAIENLDPKPEREKYMIAGTVCESSDVFASGIELPLLERGDLITIKSAGAYGTAMASRYNMHDLPKSIYSEDF